MMVERSLAAADELAAEGISAEVIDLRWVRPLDMATIGASVGKTGRLVIAEEQCHEGGWGATVISEPRQGGTGWKAAPRAVSLYHDMLIPYSPPLEDEMLPSTDRDRRRGARGARVRRMTPEPGRRRRRTACASTARRSSSSASRRWPSGRRSLAGSPAAPTP